MDIQKATQLDFPYIAEAFRKLFEIHRLIDSVPYQVPTEADINTILGESGLLLVAKDERGIALGCIRGEITQNAGDGVFALLQDIYVEEDARKKGVGKELVAAFIVEAKNAGATYIRLHVDVRNADAVSFWESNGFSIYQFRMKRDL